MHHPSGLYTPHMGGEYFGSSGRPNETAAMQLEADIEAEENATDALLKEKPDGESLADYVDRQRQAMEGMSKEESRKAREALFLALEAMKNGAVNIPPTPSNSSSSASPQAGPEQKALAKLIDSVPPVGKVPWSWTAALLLDEDVNYPNYRAHQDGNVNQLYVSSRQLHACLDRLVPPGELMQRAIWHATARPPWLALQDANRGPLTLTGWQGLFRKWQGLADIGVVVLHRVSPALLRIAYIADWLIEGLGTVVAIVLDSAAGDLGEKAVPGAALHFEDLPKEARESTATWWYVGMTLADGQLVELISGRNDTEDSGKKKTKKREK